MDVAASGFQGSECTYKLVTWSYKLVLQYISHKGGKRTTHPQHIISDSNYTLHQAQHACIINFLLALYLSIITPSYMFILVMFQTRTYASHCNFLYWRD
jgi:hypothetical protein